MLIVVKNKSIYNVSPDFNLTNDDSETNYLMYGINNLYGYAMSQIDFCLSIAIWTSTVLLEINSAHFIRFKF